MERDPLTERIIGCAIAVHRELGPGLLEAPYKAAMCLELAANGLYVVRERTFPVLYRGVPIGDYRPDLIVEGRVVVEVKAVEHCSPVFDAQVLTYLRVTGLRVGLLLNFNRAILKEGIKRFALDAHGGRPLGGRRCDG